MNTTRSLPRRNSVAAPSSSKRPARSFAEGLNGLIQKLTSSSRQAATIRNWFFTLAFLVIVGSIAWTSNPSGWRTHVQAIFVSLFILQDFVGMLAGALKLILFSLAVVFSPPVLRTLLVLLVPFLLAWQLVAIYLQDIFELEHTRVARSYILQSSLAREYNRIRIRSGTIDPKENESPLIQIGGPGEVLVELDSAALFENVDGSSRVVGPTTGKGHHEFIEGFERLREVIDLRDMTTDAITIQSRSRDGIPVIAKDVRLVYSIKRPNKKASLEQPFPFTEDAVRQLVYQQTTAVTPGQAKIVARDDYWKQTYKRWSGAMPGLIQGALSDFVNERALSEFLANIGRTELDALEHEQTEIRQTFENIASAEVTQPQVEERIETPRFTPRARITNLFYDFTSGFPKRAENRGGQLEWIGVGTWSTPASAELISQNHLEAWRISRENYLRGHPQALEHIQDDARLQELQTLIHKTPLMVFRETGEEKAPPGETAKRMLRSYSEQIKTGRDLLERDLKTHPETHAELKQMTEALKILIGFLAHWLH